MKQSVTFNDFCDAFRAYDRYDSYGYQGLRIIFDYLEQYEQDCNEEIELDVIAICCDYTIDTWQSIADVYGIELDPTDSDEEQEQQVIDFLEVETIVLGRCVDGIVYQCF